MRSKVKKQYPWIICLACMWINLCNMGLCSNILTVYLPFIEATGISGGMGSAILMVRSLFSFLATFAVGVFYQKFSLRTGVMIATLIGALGPVVFCLGRSPFIFYAGAALCGICYGAGTIFPISLLLSNWFNTHRALALGIAAAGSGVSTLIFPPLLSSVIIDRSLNSAFLIHAVFMAVSAVLLFLVIKDRPSDIGTKAFGAGEEIWINPKHHDAHELSRRALWILAVMMLLNGCAGFAFSGHLSVLARTCGYSAQTAASVVSIFGLTLIISKFAAGGIADRIGTLKCSAVMILIYIAGCFFALPMNGTDTVWCYLLVIFLGFGASIYNVGPPLWAADLSSRLTYAKTLRWLQIFYNLGGIVFTMVPGLIADRTGEYKSSYIIFAVMMAASLVILLLMYHRHAGNEALPAE